MPGTGQGCSDEQGARPLCATGKQALRRHSHDLQTDCCNEGEESSRLSEIKPRTSPEGEGLGCRSLGHRIGYLRSMLRVVQEGDPGPPAS